MKADQSFLCTFCAVLYCLLHSTDATKDVLLHLDLSNSKELNWSPFKEYNSDYRTHLISWYEKILKTSISKVLTNKFLHQGLQDLSQEQLLALSELVSAQLNSNPEHELKLKKVTHIFNNDKKSLVYDLVNLVRNSANNYNGIELNMIPKQKLRSRSKTSRRTAQLTPKEDKLDQEQIGIEAHVIDPKTINEELMRDFYFVSTKNTGRTRSKRSAAKLVHKLIRIPPLNLTDELLTKETIPLDMKLNTSSFAGPYFKPELDLDNNTTLTYEQIEDLAFADLNGTEIELNVNDTDDEYLPSPEELVAGPRYRIPNKHRISLFKAESKRKRIPIRTHQIPILQRKCERFTASMCIKADDYPMEQIMGSIRRHKNAMSALLAEYHDKAAELEYQEQLEEYQFNSKRREDGNVITPGGMCASIVRYARPQKARSASGEWKYIVNTGRHTQTLRLEKCSTPQESCSYLSHNYRSRCTQVYNYHRLLSWDKTRGLHVDIFKVPTCCSCQVDGYRETFPPLGGSKQKDYKDYTPVSNNNPYTNLNDEIDYEDEDEDDGPVAYQFGSGFNKKNFQHSELLLGSSNVRTKVSPPRLSPTVGSYLSPPSDSQHVSKTVRPTYYTNSNMLNGRSRKPYKNYIPNESRVDLEISGTEQSDKEMRVYSINDSSRIHHKRTRLHSGSSNIETPYQTSGPLIPSEAVPSYSPTTEPPKHMGIDPSTKDSTNRKEVNNGKRINYNYHPIIDFFESHQKSGKGQLLVRNTGTNSIPMSTETITSRDRRIGYGIGGPENSWHPLVVNS